MRLGIGNAASGQKRSQGCEQAGSEEGYRTTRIITAKAQTSEPAGFTVSTWPVIEQGEEVPSLPPAQAGLQPSLAGKRDRLHTCT